MTVRPSADNAGELEWFKSSYSSNEGPECVEVAAAPDTVHVRDSKIKAGGRLTFGDNSWSAFIAFTTEHKSVHH